MQAFTELDRLTKRSSNWKELRQAVDMSQGACLPYLGYFLSDLALIEEGAADELPGGLVNFAKWRQAARVLGKIHEWQGRVYAFARVEGLQTAIAKVLFCLLCLLFFFFFSIVHYGIFLSLR